MRLALVPASNETDGTAEFREAIRRRWAKWVGISVLFLLVSGRSEKAQKIREQEMKWLNILCAVMLVLILIAGYMKFLAAGAPVKDRTLDGNSSSSVSRDIDPIAIL